jgi:hypothetical protein
MSKPTNLVLLGAIATALVTTGCPATKKITNPAGTGEGTVIGPNIKGEAITPSSLKGTVMLPAGLLSADGSKLAYQTAAVTNAKAVAKAKVYVSDYRLKEVPDTGSAVTDAAGKFLLKPVPANNVWVIRVDLNGYTLATMAVPVAKKELEAPITLATTIAASGVYPLFTEAANPRYLLNDLDLSLFLKLSEAIGAMLDNNTTIKPKKSLTEMTDDFTKLMSSSLTGGAEIKKAYEAITKDLKTKADLRRSGFANKIKKPEATVPGNGGTDTSGGTGGTGGTDTTGGTGGTQADLNPLLGTLSDVKDDKGADIVLDAPGQMISVIPNFIVVPDGNKVVLINGSKNNEVKTISETVDGKTFTEASNVVVVGEGLTSKSYSVVKIGADFHVVSASASTILAGGGKLDSAVKLVNSTMSKVTTIEALNSSTLLAVDGFAGIACTIDVNTGQTTLYAGKIGENQNMSVKVAASAWRFQTPRSIAKLGAFFYLTDLGSNHMIQLDPSEAMMKRYAGNTNGAIKSGSLLEGSLASPTAMSPAGDRLYVLASADNGIQVVDTVKETIVSLATEATKAANGKNMTGETQGLVAHGGAVYFGEKTTVGTATKYKLRKFTFTSP